MLKETEAEETIGFFVTFLSLATFQLGAPSFLWLRLCLYFSASKQLHVLFYVKMSSITLYEKILVKCERQSTLVSIHVSGDARQHHCSTNYATILVSAR